MFIPFEKKTKNSNDVFIACEDDYTLEQCIMGNTYILVCSLPVNSGDDCVCVRKRDGRNRGKRRTVSLQFYRSGETLTLVSSSSNMWQRREPGDQRSRNVLWRSPASVLTQDEKNLIGGTEWVKHSQRLFWCSWSSLLRCPNCFSGAAQQPRVGKKKKKKKV